jgi:hypothetical protein
MSANVKARKILFVTYEDFANVSTDIAHAINDWRSDWEARVYSCIPHVFQYTNKHHFDFDVSDEETKGLMEEWIRDGVDIIIWAEECWPNGYYSYYCPGGLFANTMFFGHRERLLANSRSLIFHAGEPFRHNSELYNSLDLKSFDAQMCSPDLCRLTHERKGLPCFGKPLTIDLQRAEDLWSNERRNKAVWAIQSQLSLNSPKAAPSNGDGIVICHSPTNYIGKGTGIINAAMDKIVADLPHVAYRQIGGPYGTPQNLPYEDICAQRDLCHIYIDQYSNVGGIGMSSLEAMASGMISLCSTHMIPTSVWDSCGIDPDACPIIRLPCPTGDHGVDVEALYDVLSDLCQKPMGEIQKLGMASAKWVHSQMSPDRFADRFLRMISEEKVEST